MATDHNFRIKNGLEVGGQLIVNSSGQLVVADISANQKFLDDVRLRFGNSSDLQIYHSGNNSYITHSNTAGYLRISSGTKEFFLHGDRIDLRSDTGNETMLQAFRNGSVKLYYDTVERVSTTSGGAQVTGDLSVSGDLNITGDINSVSVTDLDVVDKTITVGQGQSASNSTGSGLKIAGANVEFIWDNANTQMTLNKDFKFTADQKLRFGNTYFNKSGDSNNVHFYAPAGFIPHSTTVGNNANLGASSYRWNGVWSSTGNFAGNVVVSGEISSVTAIRHANSNAQVIDNDNDTYFIINDPEGMNRILIGDSGDRTTSFRNNVLSFQLADSSERMRMTSDELKILSDGSAALGAQIRLQHANNNSTDVVSTVNFANNAGSVAMIQGGTTGANNTGYISFHTDAAGTSSEKMRITTTNTTINGDMVVGGAGNGQIKVRHIDGKSSVNTGYDALYLNYATTSPVVIGHGGSQSDLQLNGVLRIGTTAVIDYSRNLSNIGTISSGAISATVNNYQLRLRRADSADDDWKFYSWETGLNIFPASASTVFFGRDGATTDVELWNGNLNVKTGVAKVAATGTTPSSAKLHVGAINSTSSSAIAQFGGFIRAAHYLILHDGAGSNNTVQMRNTGGHVDLTQGEGSHATPATRVNSIASPDGTKIIYPNNNSNVMIGSTSTPATKLHVNSGGTNVVATFQSTDGIAGIKLQDSGGNVELSNSGSVFRVQPSGSTPVVEINPADAPGSIFTTKNVGLGNASTNIKVAYPGPDAQWSASGTSTGQVIIDLPGTLSNYDMMYMEIDIYEYSGESATKLIIGGHNWNSGGDSNTSSTMWYNVDVRVLGEFSKPIYFGWRNNGSVNKRVIVLGEPTSSWSYGTVHVAKVSGAQSFYSGGTDWASTWNVSQTTGSSDYNKSPSTDFNGSDRRVFRVHRAIQGQRMYGDTDMRSPVFYDVDNTNYRIDGASTSKLHTLEIGHTDSTVGIFKVYDTGNNALELKSTGSNAFRFDMLGTSATGQFTFNDFNVDVTGHIQHFSTLYSRANLQVLNAASNGWSTWATRNNSTFDLSVGAITTNNSILVSYSGNDGAGRDAGLKIMNDGSDWGAYIRKASGAAYGLRIDSANDHAISVYTTEGGGTRSFYVHGGTGLVSTLSHGTSSNWKQAYDNYITGVGVSGTSTKTITLTQRDGGTISANWSDLDSDSNNYADSLSFSAGTVRGGTSGTGVLTLGRSGSLSDLTVDLDGRYLQTQYMNNWTRVGYGNSGATVWHKLCTVTITGAYQDYNVGFFWTDRYDRGEASIHIHSDNDTTADVWGARFVGTVDSNRKAASDIMYTKSGSTVEVFVRTPGWREFDYIRNDAVTEGTPSITWYDESTTTEYSSQPSNVTAFTDMTPISQNGYNNSFNGNLADRDNSQYYLNPADTSVINQLDVATNIRHNGDTDTKIQFTDGEIDFFANGQNGFMTSSGGFVVNPNSANYDFIVRGDNESNLIYGDASTDRVGIGTATPSQDLEIYGASAGLLVHKTANDAKLIAKSTTAAGWVEFQSPNYYSGLLHVISGTEQWALGTLQGESQYTLRRGRSGAVVLTALTDGKVGINNNTPLRRFVVTDSAGDAGDNSGILSLTVGSGANTDSKLAFGIDSGHRGWIHVVKPGSNVYPLLLNPTGSSNGKVGIGFSGSNPSAMLDVVGYTGTAVVQSIRNPNTSWSQYALTRYGTEGANARYMDFGYYRGSNEATRGLVVKSQANATLVTFLDSGNVGIGTNTPSGKLEVTGGFTHLRGGHSSSHNEQIRIGRTDDLYRYHSIFATNNSTASILDFRLHDGGSSIAQTSVLSLLQNLSSTGDMGTLINNGTRLGFDESGTRSWTMKATGGGLNIYSGDGAGHFQSTVSGGVRAPIYYDTNNTSNFLDISNGTVAANLYGTIKTQATHADGNLVLYYTGSNDTNTGVLTAWISEPGMTYSDGGIGNNVNTQGPYYGREVNSGYGVYARFRKSNGYFETWNTTGNRYTNGGQGTRRFWVEDNGNSFAQTSFRAPIFYDSGDTSYYVHPGDTTLSGKFRQTVIIGDGTQLNSNDGSWGARLNLTDSVHSKIEIGQDNNSMRSHWYAHTGQDSIKFGTYSNHDVEFQRNNTTVLELAANDRVKINPGTTDYTSHSNVDQHILSLQTDYNAAGDQNFHFVNHNGNWIDGASGGDTAYGLMWGYQNLVRAGIHYDHRGQEKFDFYSSYGEIRFRTPAGVNGNISPIGSETTMPARLTIGVGGAVTASNDMRAPIFYDSVTTSRYIDPGSLSYLHSLSINDSDLTVHENTHLAKQGNGHGVFLHYNTSNSYRGYLDWRTIQFGNNGANNVLFGNTSANGYGRFFTNATAIDQTGGTSGNLTMTMAANGDVTSHYNHRAPIYYDSNDSNYYANPAGTSKLRELTANGHATNYATSESWTVSTDAHQVGHYGGDFTKNGDGNLIEWDEAPNLGNNPGRGKIWKSRNNDSANNDDGGWNKNISGLDVNKSYMSVVYVRRASSSVNGSFYHGCQGNATNTHNLNGTGNSNPYFSSFGIGTLDTNEWYVSVGIIQAANDSNTNNWTIGGLWKLETGARQVGYTTYKMGPSGNGTQTHRTYLYYSTDSSAALDWYAPGFYEINGSEPSIEDLLGRPKDSVDRLTVADDMRAPIYYDTGDTAYYTDPHSTSKMNRIISAGLYGTGHGSSILPIWQYNAGNPGYGIGYHESSPDVLRFDVSGNLMSGTADLELRPNELKVNNNVVLTTASTIDADTLDGLNSKGVGSGTGASQVLTSNTNSYFVHQNWIDIGASGIYSTSTNGAHFKPNNITSYGTWATGGARNGYDGIVFDGGGDVALMFDSGGNGGHYRQSGVGWMTYFHQGNDCLGVCDSTTSSTYGLYVTGQIYSTSNITAYSDRRVKENIIPIDNALEKVNKLEGVYYNRIDDEDKTKEIGFIAQEVNEVAPELVTYAEDIDQYGVKYGNTTALLVEAVKELTQQVKDLKQEIEEIKNVK